MKILESSLADAISKGLIEDKKYDVPPEFIPRLYTIAFFGTSHLLAKRRKENNNGKSIAFVIDDMYGKTVACAILQLIDGADSSLPDSWNLVWSFDANDIPENADVAHLTNDNCHPIFEVVAHKMCNAEFKTGSHLVNLLTYAFEMLRKWLDENAKETEVVSIEHDGVFEARVAVENGEKVFAIEPAGEVKIIIKDDTAIEK